MENELKKKSFRLQTCHFKMRDHAPTPPHAPQVV